MLIRWGWGAGVNGTWQNTNAENVDDLAGQSLVVGKSITVPTGPFYTTMGYDKTYADGYEGGSYSLGLSKSSPLVPVEGHVMGQTTFLFGGKKKE